MYIINGYQSEGKVTELNGVPLAEPMPYDNIVLTCFADEWPEKIGRTDKTYYHFGHPTKMLKIPTSILVAVLNIPFTLGENSREVVKKYDWDKLVGSEVLPVYNEKGKIVNCSFSLPDASAPVEIPPDMVGQISIEDNASDAKDGGKSANGGKKS